MDRERRERPRSVARALFCLSAILVIGAVNLACGELPPGGVAPTPHQQPPPDDGVEFGTVEVHFIDVGQGTAVLIRASDTAVLVDGGESGAGVVEYLQGAGVERLDAVMASHPHADHIGGLIDVLEALPVERVVTNGQPHTTWTYERFLDAIIASRAEYLEVRRGDQVRAGSLVFDVLHPISPEGPNLNEQSLVLRLVHGRVAVLLTGDIERGAEQSLVASGQVLQAQILQVAHHASHSSNTPEFLAQVRPQIAIYSAGTDNPYGHPHDEALDALEAAGAWIYGTDLQGTVIVTLDGETYDVDVLGKD